MSKSQSNKPAKVQAKTSSKDQKTLQLPQFLSIESTIGAISLLSMKSNSHKYLFTSDLEWLILPPVAKKQFTLFRSKKNEPIAFISWAKVDDEIEKRLLSGTIKLQPKDWDSGDKIYIIDAISPFASTKEFLKQLQEKQFKGQEVKVLRPKKEGTGSEGVLLGEVLLESKKSK